MDGIAKFLEMGGYAAYVWPALGLTILVLGALLIASLKSMRRREAELSVVNRTLAARSKSDAALMRAVDEAVRTRAKTTVKDAGSASSIRDAGGGD